MIAPIFQSYMIYVIHVEQNKAKYIFKIASLIKRKFKKIPNSFLNKKTLYFLQGDSHQNHTLPTTGTTNAFSVLISK